MRINHINIDEYKKFIGDTDIDYKELIYQYIDRLEKNGMPIIFDIKHLSLLLKIKHKDLLSYIYSSENAYHTIEIPKKTEGIRTIEIPSFQLKEIQICILSDILESIKLSAHANAFVKGKSIVDNAKKHINKKYVVTFDLVDFFTSIKFDRIFKIFYYYGYTKEVSFALSRLVTKEDYLPQGSPASPYLSNIICIKLDKRLSRLAECIECDYTRYADDITFSGNENLLDYIEVIQKIIRDEKFCINERKTRIQSQYYRQEVTGLIVNKGLKVNKKYKQYLRQQIYYCKKYGIDNHLDKINCTASGYRDHLYGMAYFIKMVEEKEGKMWLDRLNELNWYY